MTERLSTGQATIEDVAREAGVSRAAVSKVIRDAYGVSGSMRERVNAAIERLGYRPRVSARAMRGSTFTLGIEIPEFDNPFFSRCSRERRRPSRDPRTSSSSRRPTPRTARGTGPSRHSSTGRSTASSRCPHGRSRVARGARRAGADGHDRPARRLERLRHRGERRRGRCALVMQHLFGLGHERIAHVTGRPPDGAGIGYAAGAPAAGVPQAMLEAGFGPTSESSVRRG